MMYLLLIAANNNIIPVFQPFIQLADYSLVADKVVWILRLIQVSPQSRIYLFVVDNLFHWLLNFL